MAETSNLKLYVTPSSDVTTSLQTWVQNMAASDKDSNMLKIDDAYAALSSRIEEVAADPGMSFDELEYDTECYLHIKMNGEDVVEPVYIAGGSSELPTGAVMRLVAVGSRTVALAAGNDCTVSFRFTSIDNVTSEETGDGVATYTHLIGATSTVLFRGDITQGEHSFTIPSSLLVEGKHTFTVQIEDAYGTERTLKYTITVKAITISSTLTDDDIKEGDVRVDYTPTGSDVDKNIFFELDGKQIYTTTVATSGIRQSYTIPAQSHGNHTLKIWATATIGGVEVTSNLLTYGLVWKEDGNTTPIVSIKSFATPKQYTTVPVPYVVFDPANSIAEITLWEDGIAVNTLNVDSTLQEWNYTPQTSGTHVLKISCGDVFDSVTIEVTESGVTIGETTEGLVWKFDADGRSNSEANRDQWSYGDVAMVVPADFRWNRGGWGTDEDGYPCFTVPAGNRIQFTSKLFSTDWKSNGHYVKFIFKTANVCNYDAEVLSCYANGIGIQVTAQEAKLSTQQTSTTVPLFEDQYTELEFNVTSTSAYSEIITWAQGVPTSFILYGSSDGFIQADIAPIIVGSDDCDVRLYCVREYDSSLTDEEIFANWIADSPSGEIMMDRFARNKIVDDNGDLDPNKIAELCPDLRVITLRCPKFTEGKKSKVYDCEVRHVMTSGGKQHCWTSKGVMHKGQGTSSDGYGNSGRNIDIDCSAGGFDFDDGTHADKYGMTSNSVPVNYFNIKVDVASSESANNACLTDEYQIFNPYLRAARRADPRVRDTMEFHPCVLFVQDESGELFGDTGVHYYAAGNMGNSKSNYEAQGLNASNPNECIVELANNTHDINRWRSDALTDEIWDAKEVLEFRFPEHEDATDTMRRSFERVLSWVVSTDTTQATNQALASAVTYGGVTYSIDTADYRKAKFINEFDNYFVSDSIIFYYLFTERHLMVDNRAKNTFWHTSDGVLWDLCMDYDNDTAMGNDNEGGYTLVYGYGYEDTDRVGDRDVYNASDSVLFCNVRDFFPDRLSAMFQQMEDAGAWDSARLIKKMDEYQAIKPERIWIADMRRKYIRPYEELNDPAYIDMLHGKKTLQRAQFETYREDYCASKYMSASCKDDKITIRAYSPLAEGATTQTVTLDITMYSDCYIVVNFGGTYEQVRVKRGELTHVKHVCGILNDTETYIYTASRVQAIGDLSHFHVGFSEFAGAVKLRSLVVSPYDESYSNTNLKTISLSNCSVLQNLEICGCPDFAQAIDLTGCPRLETLDLRNTGVTGVVFATGGYIRSAQVPETVTAITAKYLDDLASIAIPSYKNLQRLQIEHCTALDSLAIVNAAPNLSRARLLGVDWVTESSDVLIRLTKIGGIDANNGDINMSIVTGEVYVGTISNARLATLQITYPELVITFGTTAPEYTVRFLNDDLTTVLDTQIVEHGSAAEDPITRKLNPIQTPTKDSTEYYSYTFAGWSSAFAAIVQNVDIYATYSSDLRTYVVKWMDGVTVLESDEVEAGGSAIYNGDPLVKAGYIWTGFDAEATNVLADKEIKATFVTWTQPAGIIDPDSYEYIYSDDPADSSGYTLQEFVGVIETGNAATYFPEYGKIKIVYSGDAITDESIVLTLHSTGHFRLEDGSALAKTTWFSYGLLNYKTAMFNLSGTASNVGGYLESLADDFLEDTLFKTLPYHWQSVIKPVILLANAGGQSTTISSGVRHLYLPAIGELDSTLAATVPYSNEIDSEANEKCFSMYTGNAARVKKLFNGSGEAQYYWTRSANAADSQKFRVVISGGSTSSPLLATYSYYLCLGLSI